MRRPQGGRLLDPGLDRRPLRGRRVVPHVQVPEAARPALAGRGRAGRRRPLAGAEQARHLAAPERRRPSSGSSRTSTAATSSRRRCRARPTVCGDRGAAAARRRPHARGSRERHADARLSAGGTPDPLGAGRSRTAPATDAIAGADRPAGRGVPHSDGPAVGGYTRVLAPLASTHDLRRARRRANAVRAGPAARQRHARGAPLRRRAGRHRAADDARRRTASRTTPPDRRRSGCRCTATTGGWSPGTGSGSTSRRSTRPPTGRATCQLDVQFPSGVTLVLPTR